MLHYPHDHDGTEENDLHVLDILNEMRRVGVESAFICQLMEYCQRYEGLRDLMEMWYEEYSDGERGKIHQG